MVRVIIFLVFVFGVSTSSAQRRGSLPIVQAHSHNDYEQAHPFTTAFALLYSSIEADVFTVNGKLAVAHSRATIDTSRTLRKLYLAPLSDSLSHGNLQRLILLVDIKDDYSTSLPLLVKELKFLNKYLITGQVRVLISGNRPPPSLFNAYPSFIEFDDDWKQTYNEKQWKRVGLVSVPITKYTKWNGIDSINNEDSMALRAFVDSVHAKGKKVRFWAAPDTEASWKLQKDVRVDYIGTDKIEALAMYLKQQ